MARPEVEYVAGNVVHLRVKAGPEVGGWMTVQQPAAPSTRDRIGLHVSTTLDGLDYGGQNLAAQRLLTDDQLQLVYQRVPDVRAALDSIVRRISTWDWYLEPAVHPTDARYKEAQVAAETARRFLAAPNNDGETWQELMTKMVTDLMVYDAGVIENVFDEVVVDEKPAPGNNLQEMVALRGSEITPVIDEKGRLLAYPCFRRGRYVFSDFSRRLQRRMGNR